MVMGPLMYTSEAFLEVEFWKQGKADTREAFYVL